MTNSLIQMQVGKWAEDNNHRRRAIKDNRIKGIGNDWADEERDGG